MIRYLLPSIVVLLAGCCHQPGATSWNNPFDSSSRIAPPPTGNAVPQPTTPYYQPPPPINAQPIPQPVPSLQSRAASQPSPTIAKTSTTTGTGFREVTTSGSTSSDMRLVSLHEPSKPATAQPIRVVEPSRPTLARTAVSSTTTFASGAPRDIVTLPPAKAPAPKVTASTPRRTVGESRTNFGYRPDYSMLQGRLEYSISSAQWKLRYIPIDGKTDRFGGSVVLVDNERMGDFEDGDFVAIDGELGRDGQDAVGYAPAYHLDTIRRL
jgi:hypothetical protein